MIKSFTDLEAWKEAHKLGLELYKLTKDFPKSEIHALTNQIRRAAVSVSSNIAEGFGRSSKKDKEHFYVIASGSVYELKSQLLFSKDLGYVTEKQFIQVAEQLNTTHKLLNGLLRFHRNHPKS